MGRSLNRTVLRPAWRITVGPTTDAPSNRYSNHANTLPFLPAQQFAPHEHVEHYDQTVANYGRNMCQAGRQMKRAKAWRR